MKSIINNLIEKTIKIVITSTLVVSCTNVSTPNVDVAIREDLVSLSLPEQVHMIQALTPEKQCEYWKYKIENTLSSKNLSKSEKELIRPLLDYITPEAYAENDTSAAIQEFTDDLTATLIKEYKWDNQKLLKYLGTIMTEAEFTEYCKRNN